MWLLGDKFLADTVGELDHVKYQAARDASSPVPLYISEYFNVHHFHNSQQQAIKLAITRMINSLIEAFAKCKRIPKILIVIPDQDVINDLDKFEEDAAHSVMEITRWFIRQIDMVMRRRKADFLERKPGAVIGLMPTIIFVCMIRRIGTFHEGSRMASICKLRAKFNDTLNDTTAKLNLHILTINSCNAYKHFQKAGGLSLSGKHEFWLELDELIDHFQHNKVKLLPNPKNPPFWGKRRDSRNSQTRRPMPTPPRCHKSNNNYY